MTENTTLGAPTLTPPLKLRRHAVSVGTKLAGGEPFTSEARLLRRLADTASEVGMTGFEPATPSSRTKYATGLRYIPKTKNNNIVFTDQYKAFVVLTGI